MTVSAVAARCYLLYLEIEDLPGDIESEESGNDGAPDVEGNPRDTIKLLLAPFFFPLFR